MSHQSRLLQEALALPAEERAELVERLLSSLQPADARMEKLWAGEAEDRIAAADRGELKTISAQDFLREPQIWDGHLLLMNKKIR